MLKTGDGGDTAELRGGSGGRRGQWRWKNGLEVKIVRVGGGER